MSALRLEDVESVYEGERDTCCCGCAGTHTTASEDPAVVAEVVGKIEELLAAGQVDLVMPSLVSAFDGGTVYIAYWKGR